MQLWYVLQCYITTIPIPLTGMVLKLETCLLVCMYQSVCNVRIYSTRTLYILLICEIHEHSISEVLGLSRLLQAKVKKKKKRQVGGVPRINNSALLDLLQIDIIIIIIIIQLQKAPRCHGTMYGRHVSPPYVRYICMLTCCTMLFGILVMGLYRLAYTLYIYHGLLKSLVLLA